MNIPETFIKGVLRERGKAGQEWLDALPAAIDKYCRLWHLQIDGAPMHGYIGIVVPVLQNGFACVLKISFVDHETKHEGAALLAWKGEGAVLVLEADNESGALLLERLDFRCSLASVEIRQATAIATRLLKRLAIQAPQELSHTSDFANRQAANLQDRWNSAGKPFSASLLEESIATAMQLKYHSQTYLVNQDLHFENVLRGSREEWLVIDPKPIAGDVEFGVAPLLWNRTYEGSIHERLAIILSAADLSKEKLKAWTQLRLIDYWLWALQQGFTDDPEKCRLVIDELKKF